MNLEEVKERHKAKAYASFEGVDVNKLYNDITWLIVEVEQLQAENQRLRDALEKIRTNGENPTSWQYDCVIAREALEGVE